MAKADRPAPVFAVIRAGHARWSGPVQAGEAGTLSVVVPGLASLLRMRLGTPVTVALASHTLTDPVQEDGQLIGVALAGRQGRCTFDIANWASVKHRVPELQRFEVAQRSSKRTEPTTGQTGEVPVHLDVGPRASRHLLGLVRDLSSGGLGLWFPLGAEPVLSHVVRLVATLRWDRFVNVGDWVCEVRNRRLQSGGVRYGVQFVEAAHATEQEPWYEPLWTCPLCETGGLLAETHLHCPACGTPQGDTPSRLPHWDDLTDAGSHTFAGFELGCLDCGVAHGRAATFCGHCGKRF